MKKPLIKLYEFITEKEQAYCPFCKQDRLAFITDQGLKLSYSKLRKADNKVNSIYNQLNFKRVECLNCRERFLINWMTDPISIVHVGKKGV